MAWPDLVRFGRFAFVMKRYGMVSAEELEKFERCPRLLRWSKDHLALRVSPMSALYTGIDNGLLGGSSYESVMALGANPGIAFEGPEIYSSVVHYAKLAEIISAYLVSAGKWEKSGEIFECNGEPRRIVIVDRWSESRKMQEVRAWRTVAEVCRRDQPIILNFLVIGQSSDNRRSSAWTKGWTHPRNGGLRFKKTDGTSLGEGWNLQWRERSGLSLERWMARMQTDRVFSDLVHSVRVAVPKRRNEFLREIERIEQEIAALPENPPMRRGSCYGFSPCSFIEVCHAQGVKTPADCGWVKKEDMTKLPLDTPKYANVG